MKKSCLCLHWIEHFKRDFNMLTAYSINFKSDNKIIILNIKEKAEPNPSLKHFQVNNTR